MRAHNSIGQKLRYSDFHSRETKEDGYKKVARFLEKSPANYLCAEQDIRVLHFDENGRRVSESETVSLRAQAEQSFRESGFLGQNESSSTP
jgi:hypothetical protein